MSKRRRPAAVTGSDHPRTDDEIAEVIVHDVLRLDRSAGKAWAIDQVGSRIEELRASLREADARSQRPNDANKTIKQVADHARALAAAIEQLSPEWRRMLSLVFHERGPSGGLLLCADRDRGTNAETRMNEWTSGLHKISRRVRADAG